MWGCRKWNLGFWWQQDGHQLLHMSCGVTAVGISGPGGTPGSHRPLAPKVSSQARSSGVPCSGAAPHLPCSLVCRGAPGCRRKVPSSLASRQRWQSGAAELWGYFRAVCLSMWHGSSHVLQGAQWAAPRASLVLSKGATELSQLPMGPITRGHGSCAIQLLGEVFPSLESGG